LHSVAQSSRSVARLDRLGDAKETINQASSTEPGLDLHAGCGTSGQPPRSVGIYYGDLDFAKLRSVLKQYVHGAAKSLDDWAASPV
jgi:hypothetical protein